jgi:hypothetical protein
MRVKGEQMEKVKLMGVYTEKKKDEEGKYKKKKNRRKRKGTG